MEMRPPRHPPPGKLCRPPPKGAGNLAGGPAVPSAWPSLDIFMAPRPWLCHPATEGSGQPVWRHSRPEGLSGQLGWRPSRPGTPAVALPPPRF